MKNKKQAIGYIRVSTQDQKENGVSLIAQTIAIKNWCESNDYHLVKIYEEYRSGKSRKKRPVFQAAIDATSEGMAFIVSKLDRFARSTMDAIQTTSELRDKKVDFICIAEKVDTTTPMGTVVFTVLSSFAQFEREMIALRTREALSLKKIRGERTGTIPYGYSVIDNTKMLVMNEQEQETLCTMMDLRSSGLSYEKIARQLNEDQTFTRNGQPWRYQYINGILKRENHGSCNDRR